MVPEDVDLRGLPFMPLDVVRLMDSDIYALSSGDEFKAALSLWCRSWLQVPAASLPNDDRILAHLSGAGPRWKRMKGMALHGWTLCSDNRWYHPVVSEKALDAWKHRVAQRERAQRRWQASGNATASPTAHASAHATASATAMQGTGTVKGKEKSSAPDLTTVAPPNPPRAAPPAEVRELPEPSRATLIAVLLRKQGVVIQGMHPLAVQWAAESVTDQQLTEAIAIARMRKPEGNIPPAYLEPIVAEVREPRRDASGKTLSQLLAERDAAEAKEAANASR